ADMELVRRETPYVAGLATTSGPFTARGVFRAMLAAVLHRWGAGKMGGRPVALQGGGEGGYNLARGLGKAGAKLIVADIDAARAARVVGELEASPVTHDEIFDADAEIFAPCALGGVLNDGTIPRLRAAIICGAANNQLAEDRHANAIEARGILYVPDYVANAGALIKRARELSRAPLETK